MIKQLIIYGIVIFVLGLIVYLRGSLNSNSFNFVNPNKVHLNSVQTKVVQQFKKINVDTKAMVTIQSGNQFKVVSQSPKVIQIHVSVDNDQLNITQSGKSTTTNYLRLLRIGGDNNYKVNGKIIIYLPENHKLTQIIQTNRNSFMNLERISIKNSITLHGELYLTNVTAPSVKLSGESNDIDIDNSHFTDGISTIELTNGDVYIDKSSFQQLTKVQNKNGNIEINNIKVSNGSTSISATNGDIETKNSQFEKLKLSSNNGDTDFNSLTILKSLEVNSGSGDVSGKLLANDNAHIKGSSNNGDVDIKRSLNHPNANKQYYFYSSNGDIEIE